MVRGYLEYVSKVIYRSTYVGLSDIGQNLGDSIFLLEIVRIYTPVSFAIKIPFTYVSPIPGVIF